jgi:hypothetical protein
MKDTFYFVEPQVDSSNNSEFKTKVTFKESKPDQLGQMGLTYSNLSDIGKDRRNKIIRNFERFKAINLFDSKCSLSKNVLEDSQNGVFWNIKDDQKKFNQFLKVRQFANCIFDLKDSETPITIVTDQCLFDISGVIAKDSKNESYPITNPYYGSPNDIKDIQSTHLTTLYEIESIKRQTNLIKYISSNRDIKVVDATPEINYQLFLIDLYNEKKIDPETLIKYFTMISTRSKHLYEMRSKRFGVESVKKPPLEILSTFLNDKIENSLRIELDDVLEYLSDNDTTWKLVLEFKKPESLIELNTKLSYIVEEIRPTIENDDLVSLVVKNPRQEKIFSLTENFAKHYMTKYGKKLKLIALYPLERIFYNAENDKRSTLYNIGSDLSFSDRKVVLNNY